MAGDDTRKPFAAARIAVRALRDVIAHELAAGHPLTAIYVRHQARIPASYERFRVHVAREITNTAGSRGGSVPGRSSPPRPRPPGLALEPPRPAVSPPPPSEPPAGAASPPPPRGSKEWRALHGIPDDPAPKPVFVARIPDLKRLAHGDGDDPKE